MNKIRSFLSSDIFMITIFLFGMAIWMFKIPMIISIPVIAVLVNIIILTKSSTRALIPIMLMVLTCNILNEVVFNSSFIYEFSDINFLTCLLIVLLILVEIIFYILIKKKKTIKGKFWVGFILIFIAFLLSGTRQDGNVLLQEYFADSIFFLILIELYFLITLTLENKDRYYVAKTFMYFALYLTLQMGIWYYFCYDANAEEISRPFVGWGSGNAVSLILLLILPLGCYAYLEKGNVFYLLLTRISFLGILITICRGAILCAIPMIIASDVFMFIYAKDKLKFKTHYAAVSAVMLVAFIAFYDMFGVVIQNIIIRFTSEYSDLNHFSTDRISLYYQALDIIKANPILGIGTGFSPVLIEEVGMSNPWYHNTFLDILVSTGVVGLILFSVHFYQKYNFLVKNRKDMFVVFVYIGIIASSVHGLIDVSFFNYIYLYVFMILCGVLEATKN